MSRAIFNKVSRKLSKEVSYFFWSVRRFLNKPQTRVFCIGFQKTGTSSLERALIILGYKVVNTKYWHRYMWIKNLHKPKSRENLLRSLFDSKFDAAADNPFPMCFRELDRLYPDAKFVLSVREESNWIKSAQNHFHKNPTPMLDYVYCKYKTDPIVDEELWINTYRQHNKDVLAHFKDQPDRLLIMKTEEFDFESLAIFLDRPLNVKEFPRVNTKKDLEKENAKQS